VAGLSKDTPKPVEIKFHQQSRLLDITFADGKFFQFTCEFLRVHSPSAEVCGHHPGQEILQTGKKHVNIKHIEPIGNYAIQLNFTDGHNTGIYSWDLLYNFGLHQDKMWQRYLDRLAQANETREPVNPSSTLYSENKTQ
jgi:DUF971 family protein